MAKVTVTSHIGGADAGVAVWDVLTKLSEALKLLNRKKYSSQIGEFRFYLMVSGEITNFKEPSGCVGLRFLNNKKCIKLEIVLGKEIWQGKGKRTIRNDMGEFVVCRGRDQSVIRKHMARFAIESFEMAIAKMKKAKIDIRGDELINDVKNIALKQFLK